MHKLHRVQICTRVQINLLHLKSRSKLAPGSKFLKHRLHGQKYTRGANLHPGANLHINPAIIYAFSKARMLVRSVVIRGGVNRRTRGKPPTLDGRPLFCHVPTPGLDPESQRWQASAITTALSRPLNGQRSEKLFLFHLYCTVQLYFKAANKSCTCLFDLVMRGATCYSSSANMLRLILI